MMQVNYFSVKNFFFLLLLISALIFFSSCKKSKSKSEKKKKKAKTEHVKTKPTTTKPTTSTPQKKEPSGSVSEKRQIVAKEAKAYMGVKYLYGGTTRKGIDCSGLIGNAYQKIGIQLPRSSKEMAFAGNEIRKSDLEKGDLVFFDDNPGGRMISHVGMVTEVKSSSSILFIHSTTQKGVMEDDLFSNYWSQRFIKAVRAIK